jgi:hypothetical protein
MRKRKRCFNDISMSVGMVMRAGHVANALGSEPAILLHT